MRAGVVRFHAQSSIAMAVEVAAIGDGYVRAGGNGLRESVHY